MKLLSSFVLMALLGTSQGAIKIMFEKPKVGMYSDLKEVLALKTDPLRVYFIGLKAQIEKETSTTFTQFTPLKYKSQVVAGTNYTIVYQISATDKLEVKVFKSLIKTTTINFVKQIGDIKAAVKAKVTAKTTTDPPNTASGTPAPLYYQAFCSVTNAAKTIEGTIKFYEHAVSRKVVMIDGTITSKAGSGAKSGTKYGISIDENKATAKCDLTGGHYKTAKTQVHGGIMDKTRHAGDLGNILTGAAGETMILMHTDAIHLTGLPADKIIGKSVIIHEKVDDLGDGAGLTAAQSKVDGNAGKGIACCTIEALDDKKLPAGARCNASKKLPGAARPTCATGCCGLVAYPTIALENKDVQMEFCGSKAQTKFALASKDLDKTPKKTEYDFKCIEGATKIASGVTAMIAAAYLMA